LFANLLKPALLAAQVITDIPTAATIRVATVDQLILIFALAAIDKFAEGRNFVHCHHDTQRDTSGDRCIFPILFEETHILIPINSQKKSSLHFCLRALALEENQ